MMDVGPASTRPGAIWASLAKEAQENPLGLVKFRANIGQIALMCRGRLCYLATPFSKMATRADGSLDFHGADQSARLAEHYVLEFALRGVTAISPISASWRAVQAGPNKIDPLDSVFWEAWCLPLLNRCAAVIVPPILGWDESKGVAAEAMFCITHNVSLFVMGGLE